MTLALGGIPSIQETSELLFGLENVAVASIDIVMGRKWVKIDNVPISSKYFLQSPLTLLIHPHCLHKAAVMSGMAHVHSLTF